MFVCSARDKDLDMTLDKRCLSSAYIAKRSSSSSFRAFDSSDDGNVSDEDNNSELKRLPTSGRVRCSSCYPNCRIWRHESRHRRHSKTSGSVQGEDKLIELSGGVDYANGVLKECSALLRSDAGRLTRTDNRGNTLLMQTILSGLNKPAELACAEIRAYARLMEHYSPALLTARNHEEASALVLAALTNKRAVAVFLSRLYERHGFDANECDAGGHSVLHMLARKGDECVETLEALLALRRAADNSSRRLYRLDVISNMGKTPLDVAMKCSHFFAKGGTSYDKTINAFLKVINEDAIELLMDDDTVQSIRK